MCLQQASPGLFSRGWLRNSWDQQARENPRSQALFLASTGNPAAHGPLVKISHMVKLRISGAEWGGQPKGVDAGNSEQAGGHWGQKSITSTYYVPGIRVLQ